MTTYLNTVRRMAERAPAERNRVVDLMRVVSILVVVFGHWLMAAVTIEGGALVPGHLLDLAAWTHPLTWLLQVMPIFFFVGGFSNALSWRSARRRGETYSAWLRSRLRRLTIPVVPLLLVWGVAGWVALEAGVDWEILQIASQVAIVPTWFLAAYVVIVALAPAALAVWERFGWWSFTVGVVLAGLTDLISIGLDIDSLGFLNYVFVWGSVHQLGYAWVDGKIGGMPRRLAMGLTGFLGLAALVWAGPYPMAMVGLGGEVTNSSPPKVTLVFLAMFQAGLVLLAEPALKRLMTRPWAWTPVVAVSAQIMTIYLWHLTAMVAVIGAGLALGGFGFGLEPVTASWWLTRPVWFVVLAAVTGLLAMMFARFERPGPDPRPAP
ncbi:MAG: acyltransferase, partial [Acidimicrobiia bacterium]